MAHSSPSGPDDRIILAIGDLISGLDACIDAIERGCDNDLGTEVALKDIAKFRDAINVAGDELIRGISVHTAARNQLQA